MLKVVIIDGNAISRNLLTSVLTTGGYEVIGDTNTSTAGIASMVKLQPQILCVDTGDAENNGMNMLESLRDLFPKALVFMVAAKMDSDRVQSALQRGVHGFIVKPFNAVTVLMTIRNAVIKLAKQQTAKPAE
ncbi:MAG TPA: response regulator [Burkholderiaceae bacterium]|jgi:DNA-binding NarL/FixJ family response regulator